MRYLLLVLCLFGPPVGAEARGVASAGKVKVTVRDAQHGSGDVYAGDGSAWKYCWTKPADTGAVFSGVERKGGLVNPSTRADAARPETGDTLGAWELNFRAVK